MIAPTLQNWCIRKINISDMHLNVTIDKSLASAVIWSNI